MKAPTGAHNLISRSFKGAYIFIKGWRTPMLSLTPELLFMQIENFLRAKNEREFPRSISYEKVITSVLMIAAQKGTVNAPFWLPLKYTLSAKTSRSRSQRKASRSSR